MALIVEYHVVADMYLVDGAITAGMAVELSAAGFAVAAPVGTVGRAILGIAGDSALAAAGQTTAYSAQVRLGADGGTQRWTENRVADFYDETAASLKITVYNGGGKFWISEDLFDADFAPAIGSYIQPSAVTTAGEWDNSTATNESAICVGAAQAYPSGVPGTDVDGHITLGNFVPVILRV